MPALLISTSRVFISSAACRIWEVLVTSSVRGVTRLSGCCRALRVPAYTFFAPRRSASLRRSEEHTSELQSRLHLVCRLLLEKKKKIENNRLILANIRERVRCLHVCHSESGLSAQPETCPGSTRLLCVVYAGFYSVSLLSNVV